MSSKPKIQWFTYALLAVSSFSLSCPAPARAQDDPTRLGDPNFLASAFASAFTGPSANVYVSVRESTGLPVNTAALVKLSCPLAGVDVRGATQGTNAQFQFKNVPVGDCNIEVSAAGYKTARDRTKVIQSYTSRNQKVLIYLQPESESLPAMGQLPVVQLGLTKEID